MLKTKLSRMSESFFGKTNIRLLQANIFHFVLISLILFTYPAFSQDTIEPGLDTAATPDTLSELTEDTTAQHAEAVAHAIEGNVEEEIKRGKRFFLGILPFDRKYESCVSCHYLKPVDTLNWNPSAMDIAKKFADKDFASFQQAVMDPSGTKIEAAHQNLNIADEDLKMVKTYLDDLAIEGPAAQKPSINNFLLFLFLGAVITWAILELLFFKKMKYAVIPVIILMIALGLQARMLITDAIKLGRQENYAPDQPVKFSHRIHAGENGIECMYCHTTAERSKSAGIPATALCMNCHIIIREGSHSGKFEIAKVVDAVENGKNIEWNRIHNLPDHVFFSHAVHVGSAKLDCKQCHGPVEEMNIMRQHSDLSMGWCVNCHRETQVHFRDNDYYDDYIKLHEDLKAGRIDSITAADIGANDCMRCHY